MSWNTNNFFFFLFEPSFFLFRFFHFLSSSCSSCPPSASPSLTSRITPPFFLCSLKSSLSCIPHSLSQFVSTLPHSHFPTHTTHNTQTVMPTPVVGSPISLETVDRNMDIDTIITAMAASTTNAMTATDNPTLLPLRTLIVDNYDSYTFNLLQLFDEDLLKNVVVIRNNQFEWYVLFSIQPSSCFLLFDLSEIDQSPVLLSCLSPCMVHDTSI